MKNAASLKRPAASNSVIAALLPLVLLFATSCLATNAGVITDPSLETDNGPAGTPTGYPVFDEAVEENIPFDFRGRVRVGLAVETFPISVGVPGGALLWDADLLPHVLPKSRLVFRPDISGISVLVNGETLIATSALWRIESLEGAWLELNESPYRGEFEIFRTRFQDTPGLTLINDVEVEDYLRGVVPREIGFLREESFEAMKSQAVAARTYAVRNLGRRIALGFDLFATSADQVYGGAGAEHPLTDRAVRETAGEILVYGGEPIEAFYHSTCGGTTAARHQVWGGEARPYLVPVSDRLGDTFACSLSKYFHWREKYSPEDIERVFNSDPSTFEIAVMERDSSGRAAVLSMKDGVLTTLTQGDRIRWALPQQNGSPLRSTLFEIEPADNGGFAVEGRGWGHGIGMCQMGAHGRSRAGHRYDDILSHYYPGAKIVLLGSSKTTLPVL